MDDLVKRLHALSRYAHDDLSIGDEAAEEIERLTAERDSLSLAYKTSEDDVFNLTQKVIPNLRAERDRERACRDIAVQILSSIHSLLYPSRVTDKDGKTWEFRHPGDPHKILQELSNRIRSIPDEVSQIAKAHRPEGSGAATG